MHIEKNILFNRLHTFINDKYTEPDKELLVALCKKIIFNNPVENCIIKGTKSNWNNLPATKSLFHSPVDFGLPIGNLTSQIFANFYFNSFDHYIKRDLQIRYYGRYVDDFVIVHSDKEYLKSLIPNIQNFLFSTLQLNLHPQKIYLQPYENGVQFLGVVIKPNRIYIASRTKGNFYKTIILWNNLIKENDNKLGREDLKLFLSSINSYLGIMKHYNTYKLRKKMLLQYLSAYFYNYVYISGAYCKLIPKVTMVK